MESSSFLSLSIIKKEVGWPKFKEQAKRSSKLKIHKDNGTEEPLENYIEVVRESLI